MNANELKDVLSGEIKLLRSGKIKPDRANAIINAAGKIIAVVRLELQHQKMMGQPKPNIFISGPKSLSKR